MKRTLSLTICMLASLTVRGAQAGEHSVFRNAEDTRNEKPFPGPVAKDQHLQRLATDVIQKRKGPTIELDYGIGYSENAIDKFMYFIPLVSPAPVESRRSIGNKQTARITSFKTECKGASFRTICEFEIRGTGYLMSKYDPASMIAEYSKNERSTTLKKVIDYIKVEGQGKGSVKVIGKIAGGKKIVDEIEISFDKRSKSLVRIGLYDVSLVGDRYDWSSRFNQTVVQVNTLGFKRNRGAAKMNVEISSVARVNERHGFLSGLKGALANMLMETAPEIDREGNQAMLDFGCALVGKERHFTFPKARNLMNDFGDCVSPYSKEEPVERMYENS